MISSETQPECSKAVEDNSDLIIKNMKIGGYHRPGIARQ